jgi:ABC-type phosphate transport system permease subunit
MGQKLQPAVLGGLLIGVLSALPFVNTCCCLWVIAGGVLTTYLLQERLTTPVTAGDAAIAGLLAGIVGAILSTVLSQFLALARGVGIADAIDEFLAMGRLPPEATGVLESLRDRPITVVVFGLMLALFIYPIFSMLGALLGVALFKRQPPPPPPGTVEILPPE